LGLAISTRLIHIMGGRIWVESKIGQGSSFHFTAKFGIPPGQKAQGLDIDKVSLRQRRVLIVDDNATYRIILKEILTHWNMQPLAVKCGKDAISTLEAAQKSGKPFDLVILDSYMPDMDGFDLAGKIKKNEQTVNSIIMMLSAGGQRGDAALCRKMGISAYLVKPVKLSDLYNAIKMALGYFKNEKDGKTGLITQHSLREAEHSLKILLAEDNPINQKLAIRILEKQGHMVTLAKNGEEALKQLGKRPYDIILMDVQMPVMDGLTATRAIREREKATGTHVPIVAMTAHALEGDRERCLNSGMDDYISKPLHFKVLTDIICRLTNI
jgi:two-component system sensor histidine kinase/response regulator